MATPVVSAAVADLLQAKPNLTPDQVKAILMMTSYKAFPASSTASDPVTGQTYTSYYDPFTVGAGYLDIAAAMANTAIPQGTALVPIGGLRSNTGSIYFLYDPSSVWAPLGSSSPFNIGAVWPSFGAERTVPHGDQRIAANSAAWGQRILANSSAWGQRVIATSAAWGQRVRCTSSTLSALSAGVTGADASVSAASTPTAQSTSGHDHGRTISSGSEGRCRVRTGFSLRPGHNGSSGSMIAHLRGTLFEKHPNQVVVEAAGVGYDVQIPISTFTSLGEEGTTVSLRIYTHVREDALLLFGFGTQQEKFLFERLISVSGIGPKLAITVLSGLRDPGSDRRDPECAISSRLVRIPGVGKKTAERIVLELKDKVAIGTPPGQEPSVAAGGPVLNALDQDVLSALLNLGCSRPAAEEAVRKAKGKAGEARI